MEDAERTLPVRVASHRCNLSQPLLLNFHPPYALTNIHFHSLTRTNTHSLNTFNPAFHGFAPCIPARFMPGVLPKAFENVI